MTTTSVPAATVGAAYSAIVASTGGTSPFTWAVASGSFPPGLSLDSSTTSSVTISGTPTTAGSASVVLQVTDATHTSSTQSLATDFASTPGIPSAGTISGTYTLAANGRGVLTQNGTQSYIFYVVSPAKAVLLPITMNPYLVPVLH